MKLVNKKQAVTLIEIMVVTAISSLILSSITLIWMRTGRTVTKGGEMMDLQIIARNINDIIRKDIRTLTKVIQVSDGKFVFNTLSKGKEIKASYLFKPATKTLQRICNGKKTEFRATGRVAKLIFSCNPSIQEFQSLRMAIEIVSQKK